MKIGKLPYFLIFCFTAILLIKVSGLTSYFAAKAVDIEITSTNGNDTEKEEKKIEAEYFLENVLTFDYIRTLIQSSKKIIIPDDFNHPNYFPEVLTPPPLV